MGDPVTTFEIAGNDLKALADFYQGAFDWKMGTPQPAYTMVYPTEDPPRVVGVLTAARQGTPGHAMFYVEVSDLGAALAKIERFGGRTVLPPTTVPDGPSIAMFADPEGHVVGLWKARPRQTR